MSINGSERTGLHALETGDTTLAIQLHYTVQQPQGICGAYLGTGRNLALAAYYRHPHHRMGIGIDNTDSSFLGIVGTEMLDGADQFTNTATGALLGDNGEFSGH
jgi:hypothetical protein